MGSPSEASWLYIVFGGGRGVSLGWAWSSCGACAAGWAAWAGSKRSIRTLVVRESCERARGASAPAPPCPPQGTDDRKQAEEELLESMHFFRVLFESAPIGILTSDWDGRPTHVNRVFQEMLGYTEDELRRMTFADFTHPDDVKGCLDLVEELRRGKRDHFRATKRYVAKGRGVVWAETAVSVVRRRDGGFRSFIAMAEDTTKRREAEQQVHRDQQRLRHLASELDQAAERERRHLAASLHDGLAPLLAVARMKLQALRATASDEAGPILAEAGALVEQALGQARALTFDLSPPVLYELGFEAALEWLAERTQAQHGVRVTLDDDGRPKPLREDVRVALFRSVRELLHNVAKHAWARHVRISVDRDGDRIRVLVEDDGVGFDPAEPAAAAGRCEGFGLFAIRERLDYLGGRFVIESAQGRGTRATLVAPLEAGGRSEAEGRDGP